MPEQISFFTNFITAMQGAQDRKRQEALDTARLIMEQNNYKLEQQKLSADIGNKTALLDLRQNQILGMEQYHNDLIRLGQENADTRQKYDEQIATLRAGEDEIKKELAKSREQLDQSNISKNNVITDDVRARTENLKIEKDALRWKVQAEHYDALTKAKKYNYLDQMQKLTAAKYQSEINKLNAETTYKIKQLQLIDPQIDATNALKNMRNAQAALDYAKAGEIPTTTLTTHFGAVARGVSSSADAVSRQKKRIADLQAKIEGFYDGINEAEMANAGTDTPHNQLYLRDKSQNPTNITVDSAMAQIKGFDDPTTHKHTPGLEEQLSNAVSGLGELENYHDSWQSLYNNFVEKVNQSPGGKKLNLRPYKKERTPNPPNISAMVNRHNQSGGQSDFLRHPGGLPPAPPSGIRPSPSPNPPNRSQTNPSTVINPAAGTAVTMRYNPRTQKFERVNP